MWEQHQVYFQLELGEEPKYDIFPDTDHQYDKQYCWWMYRSDPKLSKNHLFGPVTLDSGFGNRFSDSDLKLQQRIKLFLLGVQAECDKKEQNEKTPPAPQKIKKEKKVIFFIRHGESLHNADPVKHDGIRNPGLSDLGKKQAAQLSGTSDLIIVSPLKRTLETLQFSKIKSKKIISCILFREWTAHGPSCWLEGENEKTIWETEADLMKRSWKAWDFVKTRPETFITIVAHGALNSAMLQCVGVKKNFKNCEIYRYEASFN